MVGKSAHGNGGKIGYYEHSWNTKKDSTLSSKRHRCAPHRVLAKKLEPLVWDRLRSFLSEPGVIAKVLESVRKLNASNPNRVERTRLKASIAAFESQLEALAERIAELPKGISAAPLYKQLDKIQSAKGDAEAKLLSLGVEGHQAPSRIVDDITLENFRVRYSKLLRDELTETQKRQIVRNFIHKVAGALRR